MEPKRAIVAYPVFSAADRARIQAIRAGHDPQFAMLEPHFTLVFPVAAPLDQVVNEARSVARGGSAFSVTLQSVRAVRDVLGGGGHVFLVPGDGAEDVAALNCRLYSGALHWAHRADVPYVPHVTVAASPDFAECQALAVRLACSRWDLFGSVGSLSVVEIVGSTVATKADVPLGPGT